MIKTRTLAGWITAALLATSAGAEDRFTAQYDFYWKGIKVSTLEAEARLSGDRYALGIDFRMRGIAKLFANGRSSVRSEGAILDAGGIAPSEYVSEGRWDGEDYSRTLIFSEGGALADMKQVWPKEWLEKYPREAVPEDLQRGPDPMSLAVVLLNSKLPAPGTPVEVRSRAFDGDTVFDWIVTCAADPVVLEENKHTAHAGEARECTMDAELVAGKRILTDKEKRKLEKEREKARRKAEKEKAKDGEAEDEDDRMVFWVMRDNSTGYLLPVRARIPSDMGNVDMYLTSLAPEGAGAVAASSR